MDNIQPPYQKGNLSIIQLQGERGFLVKIGKDKYKISQNLYQKIQESTALEKTLDILDREDMNIAFSLIDNNITLRKFKEALSNPVRYTIADISKTLIE